MTWNIYLSGEIHSDWREKIEAGIKTAGLPVNLTSPNTDHASSDDCGDRILGAEDDSFWKDHKASKINSIRIRNMIENADLVIVRFGDKYNNGMRHLMLVMHQHWVKQSLPCMIRN